MPRDKSIETIPARKWRFMLPAAISFVFFYPILLAPGFLAGYFIVMLAPEQLREYFIWAVNLILFLLGAWMTYGLAVGSSKGLGKGRNWWMWTLDVVRTFTFKILYNIARFIKTILGISKAGFEAGFVAFNNSLIAARKFTLKAQRPILVLIPHCLQGKDCDVRLKRSVTNCRGCGNCDIASLLDLREEFGFNMEIAEGGEIAREQIQIIDPAAVLAVACERELASGILDSYPTLVWGVLNTRPDGYCSGTKLDITRLRESLLFLQGKGEPPKPTA